MNGNGKERRRVFRWLVIFAIIGMLLWAIRGGLMVNGLLNELGWW